MTHVTRLALDVPSFSEWPATGTSAGGFATLRFPSWSRAGDRVAFSGSRQDGDPDALFVVDASTPTSPVQLVVGLPSWSPSDVGLAFSGTATPGLYTYEFTGAEVTKIARSGTMPDWRRF